MLKFTRNGKILLGMGGWCIIICSINLLGYLGKLSIPNNWAIVGILIGICAIGRVFIGNYRRLRRDS